MPQIKFNHISRILGFGILFILLCIGGAMAQQGKGTPSVRVDIRQWVKQQFAKGRIPPFSFVYGNSIIKIIVLPEICKHINPVHIKFMQPGGIGRGI